MMIQLREPRATLWPFPYPEATGDIVEAVMGICVPWQNVHLECRTAFANAWGLTLNALTTLRGKFEDAIKHISRLATCARHHAVAREHQCPRTWAERDARQQVPTGGAYEGPRGARPAGQNQHSMWI
eukprot:3977509-Pyramimonas_sp.AAC.2